MLLQTAIRTANTQVLFSVLFGAPIKIRQFFSTSGALFGTIVNYIQWDTRFPSLIMAAFLVQKISHDINYSEPKITSWQQQTFLTQRHPVEKN